MGEIFVIPRKRKCEERGLGVGGGENGEGEGNL